MCTKVHNGQKGKIFFSFYKKNTLYCFSDSTWLISCCNFGQITHFQIFWFKNWSYSFDISSSWKFWGFQPPRSICIYHKEYNFILAARIHEFNCFWIGRFQRPGSPQRLERKPRGSRRSRWLALAFQKTKRVNSSILVQIIYMMASSLESKSEF